MAMATLGFRSTTSTFGMHPPYWWGRWELWEFPSELNKICQLQVLFLFWSMLHPEVKSQKQNSLGRPTLRGSMLQQYCAFHRSFCNFPNVCNNAIGSEICDCYHVSSSRQSSAYIYLTHARALPHGRCPKISSHISV